MKTWHVLALWPLWVIMAMGVYCGSADAVRCRDAFHDSCSSIGRAVSQATKNLLELLTLNSHDNDKNIIQTSVLFYIRCGRGTGRANL